VDDESISAAPNRLPRLLDLFAVLAVAVVVLLPKASVEARPALEGDPLQLDRVARVQDDLFREPTDVTKAMELADNLLSFGRADWAIAALAPYVKAPAEPWQRARLHLLLATARAERLEADLAAAEAREAISGCDESDSKSPAGEPMASCVRVRASAGLIGAAMQTLVDQHIDPAQDPQRAKSEVYKVLHPSRYGLPPRH
jgi:hypothetical protein